MSREASHYPRGRSAPSRSQPFLIPDLCKACGLCIDACPKSCIRFGETLSPTTGLCPVELDLEACNACGLCLSACPEPFGLMPRPPDADPDWQPVIGELFAEPTHAPTADDHPSTRLPLPELGPQVLKGTHASAVGAMLAGCRHFFGYPITPSTEGAELMARCLPQLGGHFVQAVSEVAAVNMMYGCGGAGLPTLTFTSSPGFSLMLEGISYMIGSEVPGVFVNIMRGGPGLGNIGPEQSDVKLVCRGLGHGNTHAIVLAPATPQEMLDLTMKAFELSFTYRNPVIVAGDGTLGQITGQVRLPDAALRPGLPAWSVWGDAAHQHNLVCSIRLSERDLEAHNEHLEAKYAAMTVAEQRAELSATDDADWLLVACNTPARMALGAVHELRAQGIRAGLFRPITLWPFPIETLAPVLERVQGVVMVEAGPGQLEDELRLAVSHARAELPPISRIRHLGGILPARTEIVDHVRRLDEEATHAHH